MFSLMLSMPTADADITQRLLAITQTMLLPTANYREEVSKDITDWSAVQQCARSSLRVTPVNITLLTSLFRFASKALYLDANIEKSLKLALEIILPSQQCKERPFTVTGFQQNEKIYSFLLQDISKSISESISSKRETAALFK
jgi:hypothetical protein